MSLETETPPTPTAPDPRRLRQTVASIEAITRRNRTDSAHSANNSAITRGGGDAADSAADAGNEVPWWRVPMVWVVIGGPLSVVIASLSTAVIAWTHIDPLIKEDRTEFTGPNAPPPAVSPKEALAPAVQGRNHAATPAR